MAGWRGRELHQRDGWRQSLTGDEAGALEAFAKSTEGREAETLHRDETALPGLSSLAKRLHDELEFGSGVVLLSGWPVDEWDRAATERAYWALASQLGTPVSQSAEGRRLFRVRDAGYAPGDPRFRGPMSSKRLSFHTDRCDVIAFLCLQPAAEGGATYLVSSEALRDELRRTDPETLRVLEGTFPYLRHTVDLGNERPYCEIPVFSECEGRFGAHFLRVLIDRADASDEAPSLSEPQRAALDRLEELAEDPAMHVTFDMARGDVLLVNNWTTFHRRSEFRDAEAPELRRELLRIWLSMDGNRPIDPRFADHFGATEAGAVRGGMRAIGG